MHAHRPAGPRRNQWTRWAELPSVNEAALLSRVFAAETDRRRLPCFGLFELPKHELACSAQVTKHQSVFSALFSNGAAPGTGFRAATFYEVFKSPQITFDPLGDETERVSRCFNEALWLIRKLKLHSC
jgi:hypothetical protein